ncbi:hypothetical protein QBC36DRAFT_391169 [Triangularia setosa]|uniref:TauD/TfdA-like domain-containing protein n=1 Tax=Triangularia setosa TaxID=2587417 RepID=A0AAN6VX92_9PEZI|nr:hypothetical protein QBC36DRAFT_391169 [Podospora setosa]
MVQAGYMIAAGDNRASTDYYSQGLRARFQIDAARAAVRPKVTQYADIGYAVDEVAFKRRSEARLAARGLPTHLPDGFPARVTGPLVWTTSDIQDESEYVYYLTDDDKAEILAALGEFKERGLDGNEVTPATFPLPNLATKLSSVCSDIYEGRGYAILRGLDPDAYHIEDLTIIYLGISSYVGERRGKQDHNGSMLMHVINRNDESRDRQYSEDKPFHTDTVTDCLCLFVQNVAAGGGRSVLASAWTVYNELAATRPDLIHTLATPDWPFDTYGRSPPYYTRPLLFHHDDKIITSFSRRLLVGHLPFDGHSPGIPGLTEAQAEALDAVHFTARCHEITPTLLRGDLRFINNMAIMHRREAFVNSNDTARHLVRVWLNNPSRCWALPRPLRIAWARVFEDDERGERWDIEPPRSVEGKVLRVAGSCD